MTGRRVPLPAVVHDRRNRPEGEGEERGVMPGVPGIMEAVCGYARSEGRHICSQKGGCVPADWQRTRGRVYDVVLDILRGALEHEDGAHAGLVEAIADLRRERGDPAWPPAGYRPRASGYCPCCRRGGFADD